MKRWTAGAALLAAAIAGGCASDIRARDGSGQVVTYRSPALDLAGRTSFLLPTVAGRVAVGGEATLAAPGLLAALAAELEARGFQKAADVDPAAPPAQPPAADLAVNLTALQDERTEAAFWLGFDAYLRPADLGYPGFDWAYGWTWLPMQVPSGAYLVELSDLQGRQAGTGGADGTCQVVWAAILVLPDGADPAPDGAPALAAAAQAFAQSPYLVAGSAP